MSSILVIDEDIATCEKIRSILIESELPVNQVFTAHSCTEALDYLQLANTDMLLLDINVDGTNALKLISIIHSESPHIPILLLADEQKQHLAHKTLKLGACGYLTKPIQTEQLLKEVNEFLNDKNSEAKNFGGNKRNLFQPKFTMAGVSSLRTYILNEMVSRKMEHADDFRFVFEQIGMTLSGPYFAIIVMELQWDRAGVGGEEIMLLRDRNLLKYAAVNIIEETLKEWNAVAFYSAENRVVTILQLDEDAHHYSKGKLANLSELRMIGSALFQNIQQYLRMNTVIGISSVHHGLQSLSKMYVQACKATKWRALYEDQQIFFANDHYIKDAKPAVEWQKLTVQWLDVIKKTNNETKIEQETEQLVSKIRWLVVESPDVLAIPTAIAYQVYTAVLDVGKLLHVDRQQPELHPLYWFHPDQVTNVEMVIEQLTLFLIVSGQTIKNRIAQYDERQVQQMLHIIQRDFNKAELNIQLIAEEMKLSTLYTHELFQSIKGEPIWKFIMEYRLEQARKLIAVSQLSAEQVAVEVGYSNETHFALLYHHYFKDTVTKM
ncbi:response regulator [Paenibacillus yanchengensis]|uniref:Response regulator n=1 Tax=Paenibacillus yanchengensis TaxID=2035833 RepID=A0ABW4YMV8_9BACL